MPANLARAEALIVDVPDYPKPGIVFRDITPLLADHRALCDVADAMVAPFGGDFDVVAGIEARGFLLAGVIAARSGVGMVPVRKAGKLPRPAASASYSLEYGDAEIEMHADLAPATRVLLVDDVLATGGTLAAAAVLAERVGLRVAGASVLMELDALHGRAALQGVSVHAVLHG